MSSDEIHRIDDPIAALPSCLVPTSLEVSKFVSYFLRLNDDEERYDWEGFKSALDLSADVKLTLLQAAHSTVKRGEEVRWADLLGDKVLNVLRSDLGAVLSSSLANSIKGKVKSTFQSVQPKEYSVGWTMISYTKEAYNTKWEWRVMFDCPSADENYFYTVFMTMRMTTNVKEQSILWGLIYSKEDETLVEIRAARLCVQKGYVAPPKSTVTAGNGWCGY
ncbi:hypothetical protein VNI00_013106 [Paramarasmius palmivorus]|uniref:Uncharacterized protein n=1 Tax=Paramarasmius palmivorus TaxID=297713 RepID=A0AAW0C1V8_9AGAR